MVPRSRIARPLHHCYRNGPPFSLRETPPPLLTQWSPSPFRGGLRRKSFPKPPLKGEGDQSPKDFGGGVPQSGSGGPKSKGLWWRGSAKRKRGTKVRRTLVEGFREAEAGDQSPKDFGGGVPRSGSGGAKSEGLWWRGSAKRKRGTNVLRTLVEGFREAARGGCKEGPQPLLVKEKDDKIAPRGHNGEKHREGSPRQKGSIVSRLSAKRRRADPPKLKKTTPTV